jgi:flagellar biosynthesis protein FliQ
MDLTETTLALGACAVLLAVAVVLDRRPYQPGKLSYIPLMIICLAACLILGRHMLTLLRLE